MASKSAFQSFLDQLGQGAQQLGQDVQQGATTIYNDVPDWMQNSGFGSTLKAVAGNNPNLVTKPQDPQIQAMDNSLAYKLASGTMGGADMDIPAAAEGIATKIMPAITPKGPNILQKAANSIESDIGKAQPSDIATNMRAPQEIGPMQDSLKRWNVYNYKQAGPAADGIYSKYINPYLAQNNRSIALDDGQGGGLVNDVVSNMRQLQPNLSPLEAKNAASKFINNLYDVARNSTEPSQVVPDSIDAKSVLDMRTRLNQTLPVRQYLTDGTIGSTDDLAAVATRNALSKNLSQTYKDNPNLVQAIQDYGNIKEAYPSLYQAAQQGSKISKNPIIATGQIGKKLTAGTLRTAGNVASTPAGKVIGGLGLVGGAYAAGKLGSPQMPGIKSGNNNQGQGPDSQGGNTQSPDQANSGINEPGNHSSSIPQSIDDIKPNAKGNYSVVNPYSLKDSSGNPLVISDTTYAQQRAAIQNRLNDPSVKFNPVAAQKVQSDLANLEAAHANSADINQAYVAATNLNKQFDQAEKTLNTTQPSILTSGHLPIVGGPLATLREETDPAYSSLVQQLQQLEQSAGLPHGSLYKAGQTKEVLQSNLENARKKMLNDYYSVVKGALGNTQVQPTNISPVSTMPPVSQVSPQGYSSSQVLPPINPQFQIQPVQGKTRVIQ